MVVAGLSGFGCFCEFLQNSLKSSPWLKSVGRLGLAPDGAGCGARYNESPFLVASWSSGGPDLHQWDQWVMSDLGEEGGKGAPWLRCSGRSRGQDVCAFKYFKAASEPLCNLISGRVAAWWEEHWAVYLCVCAKSNHLHISAKLLARIFAHFGVQWVLETAVHWCGVLCDR